MKEINLDLRNLDEVFPDNFSEEQIASAKTLFLKNLAQQAHKFYGGKIQTAPKAGIYGFNWFNVWYTPGVSKISTSIRDNNEFSFELSNRGNTVGVVSDSTRVLGDGDVTPPGGLGVMEGKAFLMKYLGGIDAFPLCIDSKNSLGENDPDQIIQFVKQCQHSFGAINLEDISQPNCYKVLDTLRNECDIPVWHDDAQGTACVILAGLINALKLAELKIYDAKIILFGAGAANSTMARFLIQYGADPKNIILFDNKGALHRERQDYENDPRFYLQWDLCQNTNPEMVTDIEDAFTRANVLIALSAPGPHTIKPEWIQLMDKKPIVFTCANPIPEIYPYAAKKAGAFITATGRGDFPNQANNSLGFPGILKGALIVRARKITDNMAIRAAESLANYAEKKGLTQDYIIPAMDEFDIFPEEAADVAMQAIKDGVARIILSRDEVYAIAKRDIEYSRKLTEKMQHEGFINKPNQEILNKALKQAIEAVK
ncbi:MAG: NADP-dependent malic enzyme [Candidatus Marinimicrobia bacterium]|nr:NADP-dependent malic enzyme [Candidatus Neomarinimicrobiota bacterium]